MSKLDLIDMVVSIEQEAQDLVNLAQKASDDKIAAAYADAREQVESALKEARNIKKEAQNYEVSKSEEDNLQNSPWKLELDKLVENNKAETIEKIISRSLDYERS